MLYAFYGFLRIIQPICLLILKWNREQTRRRQKNAVFQSLMHNFFLCFHSCVICSFLFTLFLWLEHIFAERVTQRRGEPGKKVLEKALCWSQRVYFSVSMLNALVENGDDKKTNRMIKSIEVWIKFHFIPHLFANVLRHTVLLFYYHFYLMCYPRFRFFLLALYMFYAFRRECDKGKFSCRNRTTWYQQTSLVLFFCFRHKIRIMFSVIIKIWNKSECMGKEWFPFK